MDWQVIIDEDSDNDVCLLGMPLAIPLSDQ